MGWFLIRSASIWFLSQKTMYPFHFQYPKKKKNFYGSFPGEPKKKKLEPIKEMGKTWVNSNFTY